MRQDDKRWYQMRMLENGSAEIELLGDIGFWGVTVADFKAEFDEIRGADSIRLLVNSYGGDVSEGLAMYNLLSGVRGKLTVEVLGIAASAASVVALAGSRLLMGEGTYLMIHDPWGVAMGNADDMLKMAEVLEKMRNEFADIYSRHSDLSKEEALAAMKDETWYTAAEAVDAGFADEVIEYEENAVALVSLSEARKKVIESEVNMKLQISRLRRETETDLRDAGMSRSNATAETGRIFRTHREDGPAQSESEDPRDSEPDDEDLVLVGRARRANTVLLERRT